MHYDLNKIKVKNVISYNNDIHFEGECEYDNGECISYAKNKGNKYNNGNSDNNGNVNEKYSNKQKHGNNDSNKQKHGNNDSNKQKHGNNNSNKQKYGNNDSNNNKLIKVINNYEIECLYKINVNNYYKNINIYNYKNKLII
jgi:hypothetical protein